MVRNTPPLLYFFWETIDVFFWGETIAVLESRSTRKTHHVNKKKETSNTMAIS
jgi:hypothetical protein